MSDSHIPLLDLKSQYSSIKDEINEAITRVLNSQQFILGKEVEGLETDLADYCQCKYAFGVSSGTDALLLSLMAIGIKPGDEIITTPYSFFATAGSIVRVGGIPIFVDIDPSTYNIEADQIETKVTSRTKAIIPVHLAGQVANMDTIMEVANRYGLYIIEDACQAIGADYKGKKAGSIGHFGCFSFYPSKNLGGYGDSGLVTCNDTELANKVFMLRNHGQKTKYNNQLVGGNFRMDALQAAILHVKLKYLEDWTCKRRKNAAIYDQLFTKYGIAVSVNEFGISAGIVPPYQSGDGRHIFHLYVIRAKKRDEMAEYLKTKGIASEIYYPTPLHLQECFSEMGFAPGDFPQSERASKETLALPIYPELTEAMLGKVVEAIDLFLKA